MMAEKTFNMSFRDQFLEAVTPLLMAFPSPDNGMKSLSRRGDAMTVKPRESGLVYIDPPYFSPFSDNE